MLVITQISLSLRHGWLRRWQVLDNLFLFLPSKLGSEYGVV